MKNHTIKTPTAELLIVELPRACDFDLYHYQDKIYLYDQEAKEVKSIDGSYTLLGKPDEISEEDAEKLFYNPIDSTNLTHYANLRNLFSLIESEIYWENPKQFGMYAMTPTGIKDTCYDDWQEAEARTFDRKRTIILKKN